MVFLGFYFEQNAKILSLNTTVSFIAYKIFIYKMRCRSQNKTLQNTLVKYLKNNIRYITVIFVNISKIQIFRTNIVKCADML